MASQAGVGQALQGASVSVMGLKVKDVGGVTAVYGSVGTDEDKRKAEEVIEATVGKISNHLEVQAPIGRFGAKQYTVKPGDTLSKIAKDQYGDAEQWKKIHAANADLIEDPDEIQPGWTLDIP